MVGTYTLLKAARSHWSALSGDLRAGFRFHHVSNDEVFGTLAILAASTKRRPMIPDRPMQHRRRVPTIW